VGFEPSESSDRTARCAKQRAPLYATHALHGCLSRSGDVELEAYSTGGFT
jgi:hypothetical protein